MYFKFQDTTLTIIKISFSVHLCQIEMYSRLCVLCIFFENISLVVAFYLNIGFTSNSSKTIQANTPSHPIFYINSDHRTKLQKQICWQFLNIIWILCRKAHFRPRHINQTTPFWFWETTMSAPHHHHHHQLQTLSQFHPFIHLSYLLSRSWEELKLLCGLFTYKMLLKTFYISMMLSFSVRSIARSFFHGSSKTTTIFFYLSFCQLDEWQEIIHK